MANPSVTNLLGSNTGPAYATTTNTQSPFSDLQSILVISVTITPVATATITVAEQSFGLNGASFATAATNIKPGDVILAVNPPSTTAGLGIGAARVDASTTDKFYVQFINPTAGSLTAPSGVYQIMVGRPSISNLSAFPTAVLG